MKKIPIMVYADPEVETTVTIKPFSKIISESVSFDISADAQKYQGTNTASLTAAPGGHDQDMDYD